ncbi:glycosyltransferase, partial [Patescibacteria group bacterium]|nr:glycosyltransferase [Patescibacteria group bacterium]
MRRYFSAAEKLKIIELVKNQGVSVSDACRKSRIARKTFYGWLKRYRRERAEGKELTARYVSGGEHWKSLDAKLEGKIVNLAVKDPRNSVHKIARVLPTISNTGVQKVLERNGLSTRGKREIFAQQVRNGAVEYPLPLSTKIHYFLRELPAYPHIFDNQAVRRWGILAFSTVLLTLLGGTFLVGVYGWVKVVLGTPGMSPLGLMFASASLATGSFFFLYSFKYYVSLALVLSFSRRGKKGGAVRERGLELREKWSEAGERPGVLGQLVRMGNPVLKRVEGVGEGRGLMRWLFAAGEEEEEKSGALINGEIEGIELERKPFVSIHLPMYNEKRVVKRLIESCASMDYLDENGLPNYEILICDDSTDETTKIVEQLAEEINERVIADFSLRQENRGLKSANTNSKSSAGEAPAFIRVLHRPTRKGFKGAALKYALDASHPRTEFIMVFDADFVPFPDTIELFLKHFQFVGKGLSRTKIRKSKVAAVTGYQWHVLNKDENWITRGVRTEYSGSYLIERPARELIGALKIIHGSVYMIRKNALAEVGWGTSITEDFELTLKLYEKGYKVVFTPYVQAPAECVSTLKRLFRQRMRWAEGHSNNVRKMYRRLMFGKWKTENRGQKTEEEDRREKADSRFSIFRRQSSPKGRTWVPSPLSFIEKLEFLYLSPYYLQAALFLVGNISWLIAELVFRVKLPFWTSIWGWSMVLTNMLALPLMNMVGLFVEESEKKDYMGLLSFIALCYLVVPFQAYASVKGFLEKEEGTWFRTPKTGRITFSLARSRFSRLIKIFFPMGSTSSPQVGKGLAVKPSFLEPRQSALNWFDDVSHYVGGINRGMKMIGRTVLVFVLLISTLLFNFAPLIEMGVAPVRAGGSVGLKPGEEAGEEKSQALEDSSRPGFGESPAEPDPGVALTDNRVDGEKVSSSKKQVVSEDDQESKLKVEEHNPEKTPEEFYLTVDQIVKARNEGNDLKALREVQLLEGRDSVQMVVGDRQATSLVSDVVKSQIKEIGGEEYLPYYWTKIRMGEEEEAYMIFLRSEAGVQAYVIGTQSMTIALLELEDGAGLSAESAERFEIKALSKPIYQYLTEEVADSPKLSFESPKSLAFSSANWKDYTELLPMEIKAEEKDGVAIFTQEYKLVSSGKTPMVVGETELRVGREGGKQISKLTFRLRDNKNVNRVLWENRVMDGAGCVGDDSADAGPFPGEVDLEPTLLPILVPTPEPVVGVVGAKPTVETLGVTPSNPSLLSVSSILPTVSPMTEVEEITLTGWRAVWQAIAGAARWVYGVVGGAVSRVVSVMVDLFSRVWAWLSVGSGVVYAVGEIGEDKSGESPISSLRCGNVVIDWGDFGETNVVANFSSRSEDRRMNSATTDSSLLTTPIITFYPSGIRGALEVDPTITTTIAATYIEVTNARLTFRIKNDVGDRGTIDYIRWAGTATDLNTSNSNEIYFQSDGWVSHYSSAFSAGNFSMDLIEQSPTRAVIRLFWDWHQEAIDQSWAETIYNEMESEIILTIYPYAVISKVNWSRNDTDTIQATQWRWYLGNADEPMTDAYYKIDDSSNSWIDWTAGWVNTNPSEWVQFKDNLDDDEYLTWAYYGDYGTGNANKPNFTQYSGYIEYHFDLMPSASATSFSEEYLWLMSQSDDNSTEVEGYSDAFRNPDSLTDGLSIGSAWSDSDENSASDNFNEAEGAYVLQANGRSAKWEIDGNSYTRYKPAFKLRKWRKNTEPETVKLNDSVLTSGTDYNVDHKPFSEAWYYDYNAGVGSAYTKLADGGDAADTDEYVGDTATNYTFLDNFDESGTAGDLFYLGADDKFSGVNVLMQTLGAYAAGSPSWLTWQYCSANTDTATTCDTWSSLADLKSGDSKLVQSLMSNGNFYFDAPSGWVKATANSGRSLYYIRGYNTGAAFTTSPIESKITTDILLFQYLDDISSDDAVFEIDPASHPALGRHYLDDPYLEGFWTMEEDGSTAEPDLSSNGNNLTVSASDTIPASADEKEGNYSRDFESDEIDTLYIEDGDQTGLDITGNITVMCWYSLEV